MKKHSLFKIIMASFLILVLFTWLLPAGTISSGEYTSAGRVPLGIFDLTRTPLIAVANLVQFALAVLAIGALYGVFNKTGVYTEIVDDLSKKCSNKMVYLFAIIFILLMSLTGNTYATLLLVPFVAAVLLKKGYSKLVAFLTTIGSMLTGVLAATSNYEVCGQLASYLGTEYGSNKAIKICILIMVSALYLLLIKGIINNNSSKKQSKESSKAKKTSKAKTTKETVKEDEVIVLYNNKCADSKKSKVPFYVLVTLFIVICFVATFEWSSVFTDFSFFYDLYEKITSLEIAGIPIFSYVLGNFSPFGYWSNYELIIFICLFIPFIGWMYSVSIDDMIDGAIDGVKQTLKPAFLALCATFMYAAMFSSSSGDNIFYTLLHYDSSLITKVATALSAKAETSAIFSTISYTIQGGLVGVISFIGGLIFADFQSLVAILSTSLASVISTDGLNLITLVIQMVYGLAMFVSPSSIILVIGLSYFDIPVKEYLKAIYKYLIKLVVVIIIVVIVVALFI